MNGKVTQEEIVEVLSLGSSTSAFVRVARMERRQQLIARIQAHGIAPPDGWVLVPIITEATPFNCGINGDPPQVDHAWIPPCKVWCGRKQCAAKDKP